MPRQGDAETGAALRYRVSRAVDIDLAIMLFHDRIDQREAQPGALSRVLGGEEWLEQPILDGLGNSTALILDDQVDRLLGLLAADADRATWRRGVPRVGQQVDDHLGQALGVALGQVLGVALIDEAGLRCADG